MCVAFRVGKHGRSGRMLLPALPTPRKDNSLFQVSVNSVFKIPKVNFKFPILYGTVNTGKERFKWISSLKNTLKCASSIFKNLFGIIP